MQLSALVINAGIGDLSVGLEMAGFKVVAAYESDEKAAMIHRANVKTPVYQFPLNKEEEMQIPKVDLLAANVYQPSFFVASRDQNKKRYDDITSLSRIIELCSPRAFFLLLNTGSARNANIQQLLFEIAGNTYQITKQMVDVARMTGYPVRERAFCVVGTLKSVEKAFQFPMPDRVNTIPAKTFLQNNDKVDSYYYDIRDNHLPENNRYAPFYCWKKDVYEGSETVQWNFLKIPLIRDSVGFRRISHREIANLKAFPQEFNFPNNDRQWLYKRLMYCKNLLLIKQVAGMISYTLSSNPWRVQLKEKDSDIEGLFERYLEKLAKKNNGKILPSALEKEDYQSKADFVFEQNEKRIYFDLKYYSSNIVPIEKLDEACKNLTPLKEEGIPVLVVVNEVPAELKDRCLEKFGVSVWDIENLLWMFGEFIDIKNEFIALLDYAIEHIAPKPPKPVMLKKSSKSRSQKPNLRERLLQVAPGIEHFAQYESVCIDILKYVLGDYLTLWKKQEPSNGGLYRFDLCCKIKEGANHDFFDTVKQHFDTKYIVFEFKNHKDKITQKDIYTTEKYLYEKALRKVAIIISRSGADEHALQAAKGTLRENGKLILCLSDNSLLEMIDIKVGGEQEPAEFLSTVLDDLLLRLEK